MRNFIIAVAAAALIVPAAALAHNMRFGLFMGPGEFQKLGLSQQQQQSLMRLMMATHERAAQMHADGRRQILAVLSPAQRSQLAQIVGNLAVSDNPDPESAARQIQATLTPAQAQHVLGLHSGLEQQIHQTFSNAMSQAQGLLTPAQRQKLQQEGSEHEGMRHFGMAFGPGMPGPMGAAPGGLPAMHGESMQSDAGHVLLFMAMHGGEGFGMLFHLEHERP